MVDHGNKGYSSFSKTIKWLEWVRPRPWPVAWTCPRYQAHRGIHTDGAVENTMQAFREAAVFGYQMVEMDVRLTVDGIPVVYHDIDLQRLHGLKTKIRQSKFYDLASLGISSLRDILLDPGLPPYLNIELKTDEGVPGRLERAVCEVVEETGAEGRILFSSFSPLTMMYLQQKMPKVPRAYLLSHRQDLQGFLLKWSAMLFEFDVLHISYQMATPDVMGIIQRKQIPFSIWTVNDPDVAKIFLGKGAKSIITDTLRPLAMEPI